MLRDFYLVPWSSGFQCFTKKPDGYSIHVRELTEEIKPSCGEVHKTDTDLITDLHNRVKALESVLEKGYLVRDMGKKNESD